MTARLDGEALRGHLEAFWEGGDTEHQVHADVARVVDQNALLDVLVGLCLEHQGLQHAKQRQSQVDASRMLSVTAS